MDSHSSHFPRFTSSVCVPDHGPCLAVVPDLPDSPYPARKRKKKLPCRLPLTRPWKNPDSISSARHHHHPRPMVPPPTTHLLRFWISWRNHRRHTLQRPQRTHHPTHHHRLTLLHHHPNSLRPCLPPLRTGVNHHHHNLPILLRKLQLPISSHQRRMLRPLIRLLLRWPLLLVIWVSIPWTIPLHPNRPRSTTLPVMS